MAAIHEPIVSIIVPTFNRRERLARCLDSLREGARTPHEVIVVDGASTDGTAELLAGRRGVRVLREKAREGAVKAFNRGFHAARGRYVMWLNDDAFLLPGAVDAALTMLQGEAARDVGIAAFYHQWHSERNVLDRVTHDGNHYELCHVRGYPYANFGLLRRTLLEKIGYADERYYFFGFDPDLSLKVQLHEGLKVLGCRKALVGHDEHHDERKTADLEKGETDNAKLFARWPLPPRGEYPDPRPAYRKLITERGLL